MQQICIRDDIPQGDDEIKHISSACPSIPCLCVQNSTSYHTIDCGLSCDRWDSRAPILLGCVTNAGGTHAGIPLHQSERQLPCDLLKLQAIAQNLVVAVNIDSIPLASFSLFERACGASSRARVFLHPMTAYSQLSNTHHHNGSDLCRVAICRFSRERVSSTKDPEEIEDWFG
jgi:hypothetical protein